MSYFQGFCSLLLTPTWFEIMPKSLQAMHTWLLCKILYCSLQTLYIISYLKTIGISSKSSRTQVMYTLYVLKISCHWKLATSCIWKTAKQVKPKLVWSSMILIPWTNVCVCQSMAFIHRGKCNVHKVLTIYIWNFFINNFILLSGITGILKPQVKWWASQCKELLKVIWLLLVLWSLKVVFSTLDMSTFYCMYKVFCMYM